MEEKDITANMAHEAIARQSNEDEVAAVFRLHIMRFWSRDRIENFCPHLLGIDMQEYRAWRQAVEQAAEQSMHTDAACACPDDGNLQINSDFVCAVCHKTPRR